MFLFTFFLTFKHLSLKGESWLNQFKKIYDVDVYMTST